jgi:peptide chain release factor 1
VTTQGNLPRPLIDRADRLADDLAAIEGDLADPALHTQPARMRVLGQRHSVLQSAATTYQAYLTARADAEVAHDLAGDDEAFADEARQLDAEVARLADRLRAALVPRDPDDARPVLLEIKAGEGGDESALFAADLLRMYQRYADRHGWRAELIDSEETPLGGVSSATLAVRARSTADPDDMPGSRLKFEGGVHRVQRVPVTESQGRIHTSAAGVLVLPEATEVDDVPIDPADLRVDVYRSSGPGGQSVNTTDSAVRITHLPTGTVVSCQNEKSQLQNREQAMRILRARLLAAAREQAAAAAAAERRSQVRTVDRSERVRTYNFPENRISDHRVGYKAYNLDQVLSGDLDGVVDALVSDDLERRVAQLADTSGA